MKQKKSGSARRIVCLVLAAVMLLGVLTMSVAAGSDEHYRWGDWSVRAEFYLLNEGLTMPVGTAPQPTKNYKSVGYGSIKISMLNLQNGYFNAKGVDAYLQNKPDLNALNLKDGQTVVLLSISPFQTVALSPAASMLRRMASARALAT